MNNNIYQIKEINLIKEAFKQGYKLSESECGCAKGLPVSDKIIEDSAVYFLEYISHCRKKYPLNDEFINDSAKFMGFLIKKYDKWK